MRFKYFIQSLLVLFCLPTQFVYAEPIYPRGPIKLIVPVPPGGAADFIGRILAQRLSESLGQSFIIENVSGATGTIAAQQVARAKPDGYTLLLSSSTTHGTAPVAFKTLPYHPLSSFSHIRLVATVPAVVVVNKELPVTSVAQLIDYSKKKPDTLNYASSGNGSPLNFWGEMFKQATHASLSHVPYKGSGPAVTDLIAGRIQVMFDGLPAQIGNIQAGNTRLLAVLHPSRLPALPNTPTMAELGYAQVVGGLWYGLSGPAGLAQTVVDTLDQALIKIESSQRLLDEFSQRGILLTPLSQNQYAAFIQAENDKYRAIGLASGISNE